MFAPLGGVGEIGMNLSIYGLGDERQRNWLAVDLGVSFASEEHLPGIDLILPDIRYLVEERKNLAGLVLTHAHEDHFGALIDLWPQLKVPVYATPFTAALLEAKRASEPGAPEIPVTIVPLGSRFKVGPFDIELVSMAHSIPESNALIIRTPCRHGAAYRRLEDRSDADPRRRRPTRRSCARSARRAASRSIGDSTNAVREGRSPSEADVGKTIAELIKNARGRVAVTTFASNVARLRTVADAARAADREVVVVGRAMERIVQIARETGYLDGVQDFRPVDAYGYLPPNKVVALCTGSQGEPRAALSRIAEDQHPEVTLSRGDTRDLFRPHHSRQREGGRPRHQRADRPGHRGDHRPHASGACVGPSAPRRARRADRLGQAEDPHSGAWRGAASVRARRARAPLRRARKSCNAATAIWCGCAPDGRASSTRCRPGGSTRTARCWSRPTRARSPTASA